ncbi:MAG: flagellar basal body rod protein FlgB [Deltaproteobacteria bacterium]|nr:flagellar basal body rod protein FlgB [Deltaproteobacteria bacterium]
MIPLFDSLAPLERTLDYHAERQAVLGSNVANLNTPGFVAKDLVMDETTSNGTLALAESDSAHLQGIERAAASGTMVSDESTPAGRDGNNVSLEREMAKIMASSLRYDAAAEIVSRRLAMIRYAATDGQG